MSQASLPHILPADAAQQDGAHTRMQTGPVQPHWIANSNRFWFRRANAPKDSTFVYVDPNQGKRHPVFDHEGLAKALKEEGVEASAAELPFTHIDVNDDLSIIRFRAGEQNWEWTKAGVLAPFVGDIDTDTLKPLLEERPSSHSKRETEIKFVNRTKGKISVSWIDWQGAEKHYLNVKAGRTATQSTYEGHVWRVTNEDGKIVASFSAAQDKAAIIENGIVAPKPVEAPEGLSKRQSNGTDAAHSEGVFFKDNNVWFREADGNEIQMSTTGTEGSPFRNWTYPSPDKKFAVILQTTPGQDRKIYAVESSPNDQLQPRLHEVSYAKPGDKVAIDRPRIFDLTKKQEIPTDDSLFKNPYTFSTVNDGWNSDSSEFRFIYNERGHQVLRIVGMSIEGKTRAVVEDKSDTFIDYSSKQYYHELNSSDLIWASERDGWNHLYMYDMKSGKVKNQITKGEFVVREVDYVDEKNKQIWIKVFGAVEGQDPYYAHLARVNFDGSDFKVMTEGDGSHIWSFDPERTTFVDSWSRMDMNHRSVTRDAKTGKATTEVAIGDLSWFTYAVPERFAAPGRDGKTMIYGVIWRPTNMDNSTKYPVIEKIYAGPQDFSVPKDFTNIYENHEIADEGHIVVMIDGMGTNWRSKAFHDVCYKNLKDAGFPDRIAWMKAAASTRPWMDLSRVAVFGGSAGGQNAMGALIFHNDFYKVAAADCGCHDNRMDKLWWNEQWMGYPVDTSYEESSNVVNAWRMQGDLLLTVGELDFNVDPASTMQVVNALLNAAKDHELIVIPGGEHAVASYDGYASRKTKQFLYSRLAALEAAKE